MKANDNHTTGTGWNKKGIHDRNSPTNAGLADSG